MSVKKFQFQKINLSTEHVKSCSEMKKILETWRSEQVNFFKKDKNAQFVYTPYYETDNGVQLFPKTIFVKSPYIKFKPPQSKDKSKLKHITIPDNIFLNMNICVKILKLLDLIQNPIFKNKNDFDVYDKIKCVINYKKFDPKYIKHVDNLYLSIFTSPLNYFSIEKQMQGKNNILRSWNLGKRIHMTARATIIPSDPDSELDCIYIPEYINITLNYPEYVLCKRDPSLCEEAFSFFKVKEWNRKCFGFPAEYLKNNGGDYDGDEVLIMSVNRLETIAECLSLCYAKLNMKSNTSANGLKLYPVEDTFVYFYYCLRFNKHLKELRICFPTSLKFEDCNIIIDNEIKIKKCEKSNITLNNILLTICDIYGSPTCFETFVKLKQFTILMNRNYAISLNLNEIKMLKTVGEQLNLDQFLKWFEQYEETTMDYFCIQIKSGGIKASPVHLYQMIGKDFGGVCTFFLKPHQIFKNAIVGNFVNGLSPSSFWKHCQISIDNYVSSRHIGPLGYEDIKVKYSLQDLKINYLYQLEVKGKVICENITDYIECEKLLPPSSFASIVKMSQDIV